MSFISFEGGEGAGKSTQVKLLAEAFAAAGLAAVTTREPGGAPAAELIRDLLVKGDIAKWNAQAELLLHLAARCNHIANFIKPKLAAKNYVICDRFTDSTIAYQGFGHGLGAEYIQQLCNLTVGNFQPYLTIILDIPVTNGIKRTKKRAGEENRYEQMGEGFHERVRTGFLTIAQNNPERCVVIDANSAIDAAHEKILAAVNERLGLRL